MGYGKLLKGKRKKEFFRWLDDYENFEDWYQEAIFTASEEIILITKQVGDAYREFFSSKHDGLRYRLFQKTRCLITANDKFIQPEGLLNYDVAPQSPLDPSSVAPVTGNDVATESEENEAQETDDFEIEEEEF